MSSMDLEKFSELVVTLQSYSNSKNIETTLGAAYGGDYRQEVAVALRELSQLVSLFRLTSLTLKLDDVYESWEDADFDDEHISEWKVSISDKQEILKASDAINIDVEGVLFFSLSHFKDDWLLKSSGLIEPEKCTILKSDKPLKIFVHKLERHFGGPRIAVIPTSTYKASLPIEWMQSTKLPNQEEIRTHIHLVTKENVLISPEKFLVTWGDVDCEYAQPFIKASAVLLLMTLCQEYFSSKRVILNGKKRLDIILYSSLVDGAVTKEGINDLVEVVEWCFAESDVETRILLVVDRLSLDIDQDSTLFASISLFKQALTEAKNRYRYVILDRKKDYTKELSDLQKDVSGVVEGVSKSALNFSNYLLKDILALAFILTAGVVSKRFVNEEIFSTPEASVLFKSFSIYLVSSLLLRAWLAATLFWQSEVVFRHWKEILRTHMSGEELKQKIDSSLFPAKIIFWLTFSVVSLLYFIMILCSWNITFVLELFGVSNI